MKTKKKAFGLILAAVLLVCVSVLGTVAYLTSTDKVTNTFTVGNVNITMDEADVDLYGNPLDKDGNIVSLENLKDAKRDTENKYKLLPGHKYTKDPTIHVTAGSEKCYLFVKVNDGLSKIEADDTIKKQMTDKGWIQLKVDKSEVANVYYYNTTVDAREAANDIDVPVFNDFTIKGDAVVSNYETAEITVTGYAVQADGFDTAEAAWTAAKFE